MENLKDRSTAELWHEADGLIRLSIPHLEKLVSPDYQVNDHLRQIYAEQLAICNERLQELRQQLVKSCKDGHGLSIEDGGDILRIVRDRLHFVTACGAYHARNEGSAWLFMGWELEQRENEAQNGN